jgi:hypothetical protein
MTFVHLHHAVETLAAGPDHGATQFVQAGPGGLVAAPAQHLLEAHRADPIFWLVISHMARNHRVNGVGVS